MSTRFWLRSQPICNTGRKQISWCFV
jgi:hypothetical protein